MKAKDITVFLEDYEHVVADCDQSFNYDEGFDKYFYLDSSSSTPHITTEGAEACDGLIEYMIDAITPSTGEWIDFEIEDMDIEIARKAKNLKKALVRRLIDSNFYNELFNCIKSGLTYGRGYLESAYSDCISFSNISAENLYLSVDSIVGNQRLYTTEIMTGEDIRSVFTDLPEELTRTEGQAIDDISNMQFEIVCGTVPITERFFINPKKPKGKNYKKVYFKTGGLAGPVMLTPKSDNIYQNSIPLIDYKGKKGTTLGAMALPILVQMERYELQLDKYSDEIIDPAKIIDLKTFMRGTYDLRPRGLAVVDTNEREPGALQTAGNLPYGDNYIMKKEEKIKRIFKWNIIEQAKINSLSQGEVAANKLAAFNSISPLLVDFMNKSLNYLVSRVDDLLTRYDKEYSAIRKELGGSVITSGVDVLKQKLEKQVALARIAQVATPYVQMDQDALFKVNGNKALDVIGDCYNLPEIINSDEVAAQSKKALIQQQQQQQQMEQEKMAAETEKIEGEGNE